jgi:hypothetical protein
VSSGLPDAAALAAARRQATDSWQEALADAPQGWALSDLDLGPVLAPFAVSVAPGWEMVVLTGRWSRDGEGRVVAVPADVAADVRTRLEHLLADYYDDDPPEVAEAAADVGEALIGERSDRGLLLASLAVRELAEVGAAGHGWDWLEEHVVEGDGALPRLPAGWDAPEAVDDWQWDVPRHESWSPRVEHFTSTAIVRFFTYSAAGGHELACHTDTYGSEGLAARRSRLTVARAAGGYTP